MLVKSAAALTAGRPAIGAVRLDPIAAGLVAFAALFTAWAVSGLGSEDLRLVVADLAFVPIDLAVVLLCLAAAHSPGLSTAARTAWRIMAAAAAAYLVGDLGWAVFEVGLGIAPFPSWVDVAYVVYYPLTLIGLLAFPVASRARRDHLRFSLDVATVMLGGGMAVWHFVLRPAALAAEPDPVAAGLSVAYPLGDLVLLLGIAVVGLRRPDPIVRDGLGLLGAGLLIFFVADLVFGATSLDGTYVPAGSADILAIIAASMTALAARRQAIVARRYAAEGATPSPGGVWPLTLLPYGAILAGYGLLLYVARDQLMTEVGELIVAATVLTALVAARQIVGMREIVRIQAARAEARTEARFRMLAQHASDLIVVVDGAGTIRYASPSTERCVGRPADELVDTPFVDLLHPDDTADVRSLMGALAARPGETRDGEWRLRDRDTGYRSVETAAVNLLDDPRVHGIVLTMRDVEERKAFEQQLAHQAFHDPLTNLANRALFQDRVAHALARGGRRRAPIAVLVLDLDDFKRINDTVGHQAGDQLLIEMAERLRRCLRGGDTAARLGGDEFAVLLEDLAEADEADEIAERILEAVREPVQIAGADVVATASVGIAAGRPREVKAAELLRNADLAMYSAKSGGRNTFRGYEPEMHSALVERVRLEEQLRDAAARGELVVHFQPVVDLATAEVSGAEALVRWQHPTRGLLGPNAFIPLAEETGLIVPIGGEILRMACREAIRWPHAGRPLRLSVNLSARQVADPDLVSVVAGALRDSGLAPNRLTLEITESVLVHDTSTIVDRLRDLKVLGVNLAIDDFGTGYSALSYLRAFPLDELKIDRSFVATLREGAREARIVGAIVELGLSLGLKTVAEGVEDARQVELLRSFGCTEIQGFLISRPVEPVAFRAFVSRQPIVTDVARPA